jgi:hypothetical protein
MGTGEKIESGVYGIFLLILIIGLLFVGVSMAGMMVTGTCDVGAVGPDGHSDCYNQAFDELDAWAGQGPNAKW